MNGRPTAEIVADLRSVYGVVRSSATSEAADRLAELDNQVGMMLNELRGWQNDYAELDALRSPCPTCGGDGELAEPLGVCPDCFDGRMPLERMAAIVRAVFDDKPVLYEAGRDGFDASLAVRSILRAVR